MEVENPRLNKPSKWRVTAGNLSQRVDAGTNAELSHWAELSTVAAILCLGALNCYIGRFEMTPDSVAYADLGDRYLAGQWSQTANAYWSRLYPFLLSLVIRIFHPSPYFESTYFHVVSFSFYVLALFGFRLLLNEIILWQRSDSLVAGTTTWSPRQTRLIGYALFAYGIRVIPLGVVTPDIGVAALSFLATAQLLKIGRCEKNRFNGAMLGVTLGIAYLLKSIMFPLALVYLLVTFPLARRKQPALIAALTFFIIAGPNVMALSRQQQKITFSESGRLNYMWHIDSTSYVHLHPRGSLRGTPLHPTREIYEHPAAFEFAEPITGTYAPWLDPAYWHQGLSSTFNLSGQLRQLKITFHYYVVALLERKGPLLLLIALLLVWQRRTGIPFRTRWLLLLVPELTAIFIYALLWVENRYVGGFFLIMWVVLLGSVQLRKAYSSRLSFFAITAVLVGGISLYTVTSAVLEVRRHPQHVEWEVAESVARAHHFSENEGVACIGYCFDSYWARLAHLRIIAEVPAETSGLNEGGPKQDLAPTDADEFWAAGAATQSAVLDALAQTGANAVVAINPPAIANLRGWQKLGKTNFYLHSLR